MIEKYIEILHGKIHKMLYIYEETPASFPIYAKNLAIEIKGAIVTFPKLKTERSYIDILNIVNFFVENECNHDVLWKQILRCHDLLDRIWIEDIKEDIEEV